MYEVHVAAVCCFRGIELSSDLCTLYGEFSDSVSDLLINSSQHTYMARAYVDGKKHTVIHVDAHVGVHVHNIVHFFTNMCILTVFCAEYCHLLLMANNRYM